MEENLAYKTTEELWDAEKFRKAYDSYYRVMVNYALRFVNVIENAEDIVQEVFTTLWVKKDTMYGDDAFIRLLHISVRNRCLDYLKHQAVERAYTSGAALETEESLEESIFAAEIYSRLWAAIDSLPDRQRQTIKLACDGKSNAEIADMMSIGIETVKNHKYKAMSALKKMFGEPTLMVLMPALFV